MTPEYYRKAYSLILERMLTQKGHSLSLDEKAAIEASIKVLKNQDSENNCTILDIPLISTAAYAPAEK